MKNYFGNYKGFYIERDSDYITVTPREEVETRVETAEETELRLSKAQQQIESALREEQERRVKQGLRPFTRAEAKEVLLKLRADFINENKRIRKKAVEEVNKEQTRRIQQGLKPLTITEVKAILDKILNDSNKVKK